MKNIIEIIKTSWLLGLILIAASLGNLITKLSDNHNANVTTPKILLFASICYTIYICINSANQFKKK